MYLNFRISSYRFQLSLFFILIACYCFGQKPFVEVGLGIGNVVGNQHSLGKAELHASVFKPFEFGILGIDFSTGGNFIPGERSILEDNTEQLSPSDTRFGSIMLLYRFPIKSNIYIEPRVGYSNLNAFVHTDDKTKISEHNFSVGLGVGASIQQISLSLRYQYFGKTTNYSGTKDGTLVSLDAKAIDMVLLRVSYQFQLGKGKSNKS